MTKYSNEQKLEAVVRVIEGKMSINASAKILGTSSEHVRRWVMRYEKFGPEGLILKKRRNGKNLKMKMKQFCSSDNYIQKRLS